MDQRDGPRQPGCVMTLLFAVAHQTVAETPPTRIVFGGISHRAPALLISLGK